MTYIKGTLSRKKYQKILLGDALDPKYELLTFSKFCCGALIGKSASLALFQQPRLT
jgi:hypothetical protein